MSRFAKKLYPNGVAHPAVYSDALLPVFTKLIDGRFSFDIAGSEQPSIPGSIKVLDPFAGTGRIHELPFDTVGVELEPEWAELHPQTIVGNALDLPFPDHSFDAIVTSPVYGNRMSDKHKAKDASLRRSYTHDIGRDLHPDNSGRLQWGKAYKEFHAKAWAEAERVLRPGGRFVLNCKNHIRGGVEQYVTEWHVTALKAVGLKLVASVPVDTPSMRFGQNHQARLTEWVIAFDKDA